MTRRSILLSALVLLLVAPAAVRSAEVVERGEIATDAGPVEWERLRPQRLGAHRPALRTPDGTWARLNQRRGSTRVERSTDGITWRDSEYAPFAATPRLRLVMDAEGRPYAISNERIAVWRATGDRFERLDTSALAPNPTGGAWNSRIEGPYDIAGETLFYVESEGRLPFKRIGVNLNCRTGLTHIKANLFRIERRGGRPGYCTSGPMRFTQRGDDIVVRTKGSGKRLGIMRDMDLTSVKESTEARGGAFRRTGFYRLDGTDLKPVDAPWGEREVTQGFRVGSSLLAFEVDRADPSLATSWITSNGLDWERVDVPSEITGAIVRQAKSPRHGIYQAGESVVAIMVRLAEDPETPGTFESWATQDGRSWARIELPDAITEAHDHFWTGFHPQGGALVFELGDWRFQSDPSESYIGAWESLDGLEWTPIPADWPSGTSPFRLSSGWFASADRRGRMPHRPVFMHVGDEWVDMDDAFSCQGRKGLRRPIDLGTATIFTCLKNQLGTRAWEHVVLRPSPMQDPA